jgi:predicted alpha/beta superfamily hydrolase
LQDAITIGNRIALQSEILGEERPLMIYLPPEYGSSDESYPVLYLLDGDWHFHHVTGILQFFKFAKIDIQMIVVAVVNTRRGRDFSPATWPGYKSYTGGADDFNRFLEKELMPFIEKKYRTKSYNVIVGHSLAGTFALYSFLTRPELFDAYISLSPCLFWHDRFMLKVSDAFLKKYGKLDKILYIAHEYRDGAPASTMDEFVAALKNRAPEGLKWTSLLKDQGDHFSYVHKAMYEGLEYVFKKRSE